MRLALPIAIVASGRRAVLRAPVLATHVIRMNLSRKLVVLRLQTTARQAELGNLDGHVEPDHTKRQAAVVAFVQGCEAIVPPHPEAGAIQSRDRRAG